MHIPGLLFVPLSTLTCGVFAAPHTNNSTLHPTSIKQAVEQVTAATDNLDKYLGNGGINNPLKVTQVYFKCNVIEKKIKQGIKHANQSPDLNLPDALRVLGATENLVASVNSTMENLINHYYDFVRLPLVPFLPLPGVPHLDTIVRSILKTQKKLSEEFGSAVLLKAPKAGRHDAQTRLNRIYASFAKAIKVYENNRPAAELVAEEVSMDEQFVSK